MTVRKLTSLMLLATATAWACQVPVFRYALERWEPGLRMARVKALYPDALRLIVSGQTMNRAMQSGLRKGDIHLFFEKQRSFDPVRQCIRDWLAARKPQD